MQNCTAVLVSFSDSNSAAVPALQAVLSKDRKRASVQKTDTPTTRRQRAQENQVI
jgi:hypothetical protein